VPLPPPPLARPERPPAEPPPVASNEPVTLAPAPDPGITMQGKYGPLPVIGKDGRQAWQVYARPFDRRDQRPRIAIVITELGLNRTNTVSAIADLPPGVTLAFSPYGKGRPLDEWLREARGAGHEVLLGMPMEPTDFSRQDPGPHTLLTANKPEANLDRLEWVMSRGMGYVGIVPLSGARFLASAAELRLVLEALKSRGLLFLDNGASATSAAPRLGADLGLARAATDIAFDAEGTRAGIERRLAELEETARQSGSAVGMGQPFATTIERVAAWAAALESRGLVLAPVSAIVRTDQGGNG
jgi:polysaccharide deacetylase 2 family uncharacterized protein YibQ